MKKVQLAMVIDSSSCIDCKACMMTCKVENGVSEGHWRNWVKKKKPVFDENGMIKGKGNARFQPGGCMHCDDPTCVKACPTGATYKNPKDGVVLVNEDLCIGCGSCIPACPYGARYRREEKKKIDKCDFCQHRRARGELPACVVTCPTKTRTFGDINNPESDAARALSSGKHVRITNMYTDTKPNIYYEAGTAPLDWPVKAEMPGPIQIWKIANKYLWGIVGLNIMAVLVMLAKQLLVRDEPVEKEAGKGGGN